MTGSGWHSISGYATLPRLLDLCPGGELDAVVITHEHPDHCVDLSGLARVHQYGGSGRRVSRSGWTAGRRRIPLYCPPGVLTRVAAQEPNGELREVFEHRQLPGAYRLGPFALTGFALPHHVPNVAVRLAAAAGVVAYTGDCGPDAALAMLGADADLFIVEATDQGESPGRHPGRLLTAREAGEWAGRAATKRLMLTHFWPGSDRSVSVAEATAGFAGGILTADEGTTVDFE